MRRILPSSRATGNGAIAALYNRAAKGWQAGIDRLGYAESYQALADRALQHHPITTTEHVLDAGTGTGALARAFAEQADVPPRFDLLDLSPDMLTEAARTVPNTERCLEGPLGTPKVTAQYDRVLCGHVIEHTDDPVASLSWLFDRLRPGGGLILAVSQPHWCTALVRWRWGNAAYRPDEVTAMLTDAGFDRTTVCPHASGPPSRISCGYLATRPA
ncbi:class I SAM-dependent DNA methyltransferase [Aliiroseovarius sp. YM-037]|uniref:class I SAM-dependent DNA methyltransferase n=1 Tax=Aliiroseovarius sp. YM-037 TaxID=3341728 RepID=UPI003A7F8396